MAAIFPAATTGADLGGVSSVGSPEDKEEEEREEGEITGEDAAVPRTPTRVQNDYRILVETLLDSVGARIEGVM